MNIRVLDFHRIFQMKFEEDFAPQIAEKIKALVDHTKVHMDDFVEISDEIEFGFGLILNDRPFIQDDSAESKAHGKEMMQSYGILMTLEITVKFHDALESDQMRAVVPVPSVEDWIGFLGATEDLITTMLLKKMAEDSKDKPLQ